MLCDIWRVNARPSRLPIWGVVAVLSSGVLFANGCHLLFSFAAETAVADGSADLAPMDGPSNDQRQIDGRSAQDHGGLTDGPRDATFADASWFSDSQSGAALCHSTYGTAPQFTLCGATDTHCAVGFGATATLLGCADICGPTKCVASWDVHPGDLCGTKSPDARTPDPSPCTAKHVSGLCVCALP